MLHNIKPLYLHCVFHGIRFKVNNEDWLSVMDSLFCVYTSPLKGFGKVEHKSSGIFPKTIIDTCIYIVLKLYS